MRTRLLGCTEGPIEALAQWVGSNVEQSVVVSGVASVYSKLKVDLNRLNENQIQQYHRDGYVVPDFSMPQATLNDIKALHAKPVEREPQFRDCCPALLEYDPAFLSYRNNQAILDMVGA